MKTKKLLKFTPMVVALVLGITFFFVNAGSADAHTQCRVNLPLGGYFDACPHLHPPTESESSCLSIFTDEDYEFRISNNTGNTVNYTINGESYTLFDNRFREHEEQKAYGTNSCNIRRYPIPKVRFDNSYAAGFQAREFSLSRIEDNWGHYSFVRVGNEIYLNFVSQVGPGAETRSISLQAGFTPDPYMTSVIAEGSRLTSSLQSGCAGYIGTEPTLRLNWSGSSNRLRFFVTSSSDTILLIRHPSGSYHCNDDWTTGNRNPMLTWNNPRSGTYTIWVGTYSGGNASGNLHITEISSHNPSNPQ